MRLNPSSSLFSQERRGTCPSLRRVDPARPISHISAAPRQPCCTAPVEASTRRRRNSEVSGTSYPHEAHDQGPDASAADEVGSRTMVPSSSSYISRPSRYQSRDRQVGHRISRSSFMSPGQRAEHSAGSWLAAACRSTAALVDAGPRSPATCAARRAPQGRGHRPTGSRSVLCDRPR